MHRSGSLIRVLSVLVVATIIIGWLVSAIAASEVFAEPPQTTPGPRSVFIIPTPRPTSTADTTFQPLLTIPFPPTPPDVSALTGTYRITAPASIVAESASLLGEEVSHTPASSTEESTGPLLVEAPEGVINIVLLGTDKRPEWGDWRTDTIIVVSINPRAQSVGMLSIPRDLWIQIPGFGVGRINTVDFIGEWKDAEGGGTGLLKRTIETNLGLPIHRYARINLEGFIQVIDALGGVTIDIDCPVHDAFLDEPLTGEEGFTPLDLDVGMHHLDGLTALRYARSRQGGTDFNRAKRQQKLLRSLAEQNLDWHLILKLPRLWESLGSAVQTDLTLPEMLQLASVGVQIKQNRVQHRFIDWRTTENWVTPGGAQVLLPNHETLPQAVAEFLNPPKEDVRLVAEHARIEVQNGTTIEGLAAVVAKRLVREGFQVVSTGRAGRVQRSILLVYNDKPRTVEALQDVLRLSPDAVLRSPEPDDWVDIRVMLGSDLEPCP
ncbi:MAG: LCP family protein [Anaerolineae bacterium]